MLDTMNGTIDHRLLLNYAADPDVVARLLPPPFRPQLVVGRAVVGVCMLRLTHLRPAVLPAWAGVSSDNAAHRIAVEWDEPHGVETGVFVLRRDSAQRLPVLAGGRAFPGVHGRASFTTSDGPNGLAIAYRTADGLEVEVDVRPTGRWNSQLFASPADASSFFEEGGCGWSPDRRGGLEGVELLTQRWRAEPVEVHARATFYDDEHRFPRGSITLDAALLMRDTQVTWRRVPGSLSEAAVGSTRSWSRTDHY
jgi:hypothetical protein